MNRELATCTPHCDWTEIRGYFLYTWHQGSMEQNRLIPEQNQDQEKIQTDWSVDPCLTPAISVMMKSNVSSVALLVSAFEPIFFTFEIILKSGPGFQKVFQEKSSLCWWLMLEMVYVGDNFHILDQHYWWPNWGVGDWVLALNKSLR